MLIANESLLPPRLAHALPHMHAEDWLASYRSVEAIGQALDRMSAHRLRRANRLAGAVEELRGDYAAFEADFRTFFADATEFAESCREALPARIL